MQHPHSLTLNLCLLQGHGHTCCPHLPQCERRRHVCRQRPVCGEPEPGVGSGRDPGHVRPGGCQQRPPPGRGSLSIQARSNWIEEARSMGAEPAGLVGRGKRVQPAGFGGGARGLNPAGLDFVRNFLRVAGRK
eukprot:356975-Chlamydomonas_euryale.AAC.4